MILNAHLVHFKNEVENVVYCPEIHHFGHGELINDAKLNFYQLYVSDLEAMRLDTTDMGDGFKNALERHLVTTAKWNIENGILIPPVYSTWEESYKLTLDFYADSGFIPKFQYGWEIKIAVPLWENQTTQRPR